MNATIRQNGDDATVEIVESGGTAAKAVEIVHGTPSPVPHSFVCHHFRAANT